MNSNNMTVDYSFLNLLCDGDMERFENCMKAKREFARNEDIEFAGYNENSGYVYLVLTNGIQIAEAFNDIEYIVTDYETGEESFNQLQYLLYF